MRSARLWQWVFGVAGVIVCVVAWGIVLEADRMYMTATVARNLWLNPHTSLEGVTRPYRAPAFADEGMAQ